MRLNLTTTTALPDNKLGGTFGQESVDAVWIIVCTFIIFTMQSGFAMLESGLNAIFKKCPYLEFFHSLFSRIWTKYGELTCESQTNLRIQSQCGKIRTRKTTLFTQYVWTSFLKLFYFHYCQPCCWLITFQLSFLISPENKRISRLFDGFRGIQTEKWQRMGWLSRNMNKTKRTWHSVMTSNDSNEHPMWIQFRLPVHRKFFEIILLLNKYCLERLSKNSLR